MQLRRLVRGALAVAPADFCQGAKQTGVGPMGAKKGNFSEHGQSIREKTIPRCRGGYVGQCCCRRRPAAARAEEEEAGDGSGRGRGR